MNWKDVQIPDRMKHLERDPRGYPVPAMAFRDLAGKPHFTITDEVKRRELITRDCCSICGTKLLRGRWLVGGPLSAFHDRGAYLDPPMHHECMTYAMQVCPYLAVPKYRNRIEAGTLSDDDPTPIMLDPNTVPDKPPLFVCVMTTGQKLVARDPVRIYVIPKRPYLRVEFWRDGVQLAEDEGMRLAREEIDRPRPPVHIPTRRKPGESDG